METWLCVCVRPYVNLHTGIPEPFAILIVPVTLKIALVVVTDPFAADFTSK